MFNEDCDITVFNKGLNTAKEHYLKVDRGRIFEHPLPKNPYRHPEETYNPDPNWYSWNRGWNEFHFMSTQYDQQMRF